jgi:hypothetical protein
VGVAPEKLIGPRLEKIVVGEDARTRRVGVLITRRTRRGGSASFMRALPEIGYGSRRKREGVRR